jgi:hypothetical protein
VKRVFVTISAAAYQPAPDLETLRRDEHGAYLVPDGGRVSIAGEEWSFRDVGAFALPPDGSPFPVTITGPNPTMIAPCRAMKVPIALGVAPASVIEASDDRPLVMSDLGVAKWGAS